jgi:tungstate transport system substrate-binding protein
VKQEDVVNVRSVIVQACVLLWAAAAATMSMAGEEQTIIVASTTSTQDSGLFTYLLPIVRERTGVTVKVVAQGTGQALETARRGDADVVFVHDPEAEAQFITEGHGLARHLVMYNDFLVVGPTTDPAQVRDMKDVLQALQAIARSQSPFVSRGDRSGTHQAELRLWKAASVTLESPAPQWYRAVGQGMGPALNIASASDAYILVDRATWLSFRNKGNLQLLVQGDARLFNQYSLILVNPAKHAAVKAEAGQRFVDFLLSGEGQAAIAAFRIDGKQLYFPNAAKPASR